MTAHDSSMKLSIHLVLVLVSIIVLSCEKESPCQSEQSFGIYMNGELCEYFGIGINTSEERTDWLHDMHGYMKLDYPANQRWGAVFLTYGGDPRPHPRPSVDMTRYRRLSFDMCGESGIESVYVGIKDNFDPDGGLETLILISDLSTEWENYSIDLNRFETADLTKIYVMVEFVFFGERARVACFRNIEYVQ